MRYYDVKGLLSEGKIEDIRKNALNGRKEVLIETYRDYYNGNQWISNGAFTDTTRSGRKVWKINSPDPRDLGISDGDLATFNVCSSTIDIYSSYGRGSIDDQNSISIEDNQEIADKINEKINLDTLIQRSITRMSVDSVVCWKYTQDQSLEFVDSTQVTPIYLEDNIVGTVRIYEISSTDPIIEKNNVQLGKLQKAVYMEIWMPVDNKMMLYKYVNETVVEEGEAPYEFNPFIFVANKDSEFVKFDENNLEVSDIAKIIPIQDAINKTMTETGIIISKVAFPMVKVIKEIFEKVMSKEIDGEDLKKQLSQLSLVAGKIISAPIEVVPGAGLPNGIDSYVNSLFDQLYRITGIPKSIYVTEGLGNIATDTLSMFMESMKRKIDEKRTNIENGIKKYVVMYTGDPSIKDDVSIQWAGMLSMSKKEKADMLVQEKNAGFPLSYIVQGFLDIAGDADKYDEIMEALGEADPTLKVEIERQKTANAIKEEKQAELDTVRKQKEETDKKLKEVEIDNALLMNALNS